MHDAVVAEARGRNADGPASAGWIAGAHLLALWTFAVAQPILDLVGRQPDFLVAQRLTGAPLALLAVGGTLGIPALLASPLLVRRALASRAGRLWADGARTMLAAAFILQLLHWLPGAAALALSLAGGAGIGILLNRYRVFSNAVAIGAVAAIVAPALFLLRPGVRGLVATGAATQFEPDAAIAAAPPLQSEMPIVLVVFDELPTSSLQRPDGSIDDRRFPSFAALARGADWYPRAVTVGLQTSKAVPALLTGTLPQSDTTAYYSDHPSNLFSWLASRGGYRVVAHETVSHLCPPAICGETRPDPWRQLPRAVEDLSVVYGHLLLPPALRTNLPSVSHAWTGFRADRRIADAGRGRAAGGVLDQNIPRLVDDFLRRIGEGSGRSTLYYLHLNLPHRPWKYLPSGREYTPAGTPANPPGFEERTLPDDEWRTIHGLQRHLLQVGYADRVLGRILDRLRSAGIYERALIVVASDHGHSFRPGQLRRSPAAANVEDVLEVPLLVKRPGQIAGAVFDHLVRTVDVVPTIAAELGARPPWPVDGKPLSDRSPREARVCCFRDGDAARSFRTDPIRRQQTLDRLARLFPDRGAGESADPFRGVFEAGPRPDLLGRPTRGLIRNAASGGDAASGATAIIEGRSAYRNVRPESGFVPSMVGGRIEPAVADGTQLAISVDGTVRATAETFTHQGTSRFAALIEERRLTAGSHEIGVYAIGRDDPPGDRVRTVLTPLPSGGQAPRLVVEAGRLRGVSLSDDLHLKRVDHLFQSDVQARTGGFQGRLLSRPGESVLPAEEFFVFGNPDLLYRGLDDPSRRRVRKRGDGREQMLFRIFLPAALLDGEEVRLLARMGREVQQLYPPRLPGAGGFELSHDARGRQVLLRRLPNAPDAPPEHIPVESAASGIVGFVDGWDRDGERILGWAADRRDLGGHLEIAAFLAGREFWVGTTGIRHSNAFEQAGHLQSGFGIFDERVSIRNPTPTTADLAAIEREGLVVHAISRRHVAARLPFEYRPLERNPEGVEVLPVSDGRRLPVQPPRDGFGGTIDSLSRPARRTLIEGWAGDLERGERPRQIVIYRDGEFLVSLGTNRGSTRRSREPRRPWTSPHRLPGRGAGSSGSGDLRRNASRVRHHAPGRGRRTAPPGIFGPASMTAPAAGRDAGDPASPARSVRRRRLFAASAWAAFGVFAVWFAARLVPNLGLRLRFEDQLIVLRYARNLAEGDGLVYNVGERVMGFTTPLFTVLSSAFVILGGEWAAAWQNGFGVLCMLGTAALAARLLVRVGAGAAAPLAVALVTFNPAVAYNYLYVGMEIHLFALLFLLALDLHLSERATAAAVASALLFLTRPEGALLAVMLVAHRWFHRRRAPVAPALAALATALPWLLFAALYYGDVLPKTLGAKEGESIVSPWRYLDLVREAYAGAGGSLLAVWSPSLAGTIAGPLLLVALLIVGATALLRRRPALWPLIAFPLCSLLGYAAIGSLPGYTWHYYTLNVLGAILLALGVHAALAGTGRLCRRAAELLPATVRISPRHRRLAAVVLTGVPILALTLPVLRDTSRQIGHRVEPNAREQRLEDIGRWLAERYEPSTSVLVREIGHVGWVSGLRIVDRGGLVTPGLRYDVPRPRRDREVPAGPAAPAGRQLRRPGPPRRGRLPREPRLRTGRGLRPRAGVEPSLAGRTRFPLAARRRRVPLRGRAERRRPPRGRASVPPRRRRRRTAEPHPHRPSPGRRRRRARRRAPTTRPRTGRGRGRLRGQRLHPRRAAGPPRRRRGCPVHRRRDDGSPARRSPAARSGRPLRDRPSRTAASRSEPRPTGSSSSAKASSPTPCRGAGRPAGCASPTCLSSWNPGISRSCRPPTAAA